MIFAVCSDIHDHAEGWRRLWPKLAEASPDALILCGDLSRPSILPLLRPQGLPWAFCLGNCDQAAAEGLKAEGVALGATVWGELGLWSLPEGGSLAFTHFPAVARRAALEGSHRAVFYGHTHRAFAETLNGPQGPVLLANPGDVEGRYGRISGLLWDSTTDEHRWVDA
jgi:putative phosphoesterase